VFVSFVRWDETCGTAEVTPSDTRSPPLLSFSTPVAKGWGRKYYPTPGWECVNTDGNLGVWDDDLSDSGALESTFHDRLHRVADGDLGERYIVERETTDRLHRVRDDGLSELRTFKSPSPIVTTELSMVTLVMGTL
jgi:hypothetical protein